MKARLEFMIECGERSCAYEKGKFCRFFRGSFGYVNYCYIFGRLFDEDGWVQRHPDCIELAKPESD